MLQSCKNILLYCRI